MSEITPNQPDEAPNDDQGNLEEQVDLGDQERGGSEAKDDIESLAVDHNNEKHGEAAKLWLTAFWPNSGGQIKANAYRRGDGSGHVTGYDTKGGSLGTHFYEPNHGSAYWPEPWDEWVDAVINDIGRSARHREANEGHPHRPAA